MGVWVAQTGDEKSDPSAGIMDMMKDMYDGALSPAPTPAPSRVRGHGCNGTWGCSFTGMTPPAGGRESLVVSAFIHEFDLRCSSRWRRQHEEGDRRSHGATHLHAPLSSTLSLAAVALRAYSELYSGFRVVNDCMGAPCWRTRRPGSQGTNVTAARVTCCRIASELCVCVSFCDNAGGTKPRKKWGEEDRQAAVSVDR